MEGFDGSVMPHVLYCREAFEDAVMLDYYCRKGSYDAVRLDYHCTNYSLQVNLIYLHPIYLFTVLYVPIWINRRWSRRGFEDEDSRDRQLARRGFLPGGSEGLLDPVRLVAVSFDTGEGLVHYASTS